MQSENSPTPDRRLFAAYVLASLIAIFYLPTLVPLHPVESDSYIFGYNNRVGEFLVLLLAGAGALWTKGLNLKLAGSGLSRAVPRRVLWISLFAIAAGCVALYALVGRVGGVGESAYQIDRVYLMLQGKTPYVDFEYAYGAAFLYLPLLFLHLFPINPVQAYYLFWMLSWLLGTLLLYATINMVDYSTPSKSAIFVLIYGTGFFYVVTMGTNYTFLRYTCPLFFVLVTHKLFNRGGEKWREYAVVSVVVFTITLLFISPETAIAYAFASACIVLVSPLSRSSKTLVLLAGGLVLSAVFWVALKLHVLDTLKAFGGGAFNLPIWFAPHILMFLAALFVCSCYVFQRLSTGRTDDNTIGLIAYSIPMIASALGRCDGYHVFFNGEGIFIASMCYVSNYQTAWKWYKRSFIVFLIMTSTESVLWINLPPILRFSGLGNNPRIHHALTHLMGFSSPAKQLKWETELVSAKDAASPVRVDFSVLYPTWTGNYLAPLGYRPNHVGSYFSDRLDYGHYLGTQDAVTPEAIAEKIDEIKDHPEKGLLLPGPFSSSYCRQNIGINRHFLSVMYAFPYWGRAVHPESNRQPICDYIIAHYDLAQEPTPKNFEYGLWVAKPAKQ
jgi:hypothetical protein